MLTTGSAITGSGGKKGRLELFQLQKHLEMSVEKGIGTRKSKNVLTSFRFFRLVKAAFSCRVRTLGVQEQVAEVAAERLVFRHQAERAAVAAYLSGKQTGLQRSTPGGGGKGGKHKDADVVEDNLGEFGFPGFSLEEGDLTGALVQGHDDTVVAEELFSGC